jgi:hypothetical protein
MSSSTTTAAARQRSKFTADVIQAIEELEIRRCNRPARQLADAAWQKLQYDLPVLEVAELQALLEHLRCVMLLLTLLNFAYNYDYPARGSDLLHAVAAHIPLNSRCCSIGTLPAG